jgi:uncharacterized protein (TIGR02145 family)
MKYSYEIVKPGIFLICSVICLTACKKEPEPLALTTAGVTDITYLSATSGGDITSDGGSVITSRGVCWSIAQSPTTDDSKTEDGSGSGAYSSTLTDLTPNTTYYVRAYATNSDGTAYGDELPFSTGLLTDIEGNTYNAITIGDQVWMQENLKVTKLNDGTEIPNVTDEDTWGNTNEPGFGWYDNYEATYGDTYGAMYNWYTVNTGKLCPDGWHVPTDAEWTILTDFLGGEEIAGGKLKEAGTEHWDAPNTDATNVSGFTALPGGYRSNGGEYYSIKWQGRWWTSSIVDNMYVWTRHMQSNIANVNRYAMNRNYGFSVRCLKD